MTIQIPYQTGAKPPQVKSMPAVSTPVAKETVVEKPEDTSVE